MTAANLQNLFLREKTLENYTDNSILELILTTAGVEENVPEIITDLMDSFGSLKGILEARPEQLMKIPNMTKQAATMISMVTPLTRIWERCNMQNPGVLNSAAEAEAYCKSLLMGERTEKFYVIALNSRCIIQGARKISDGTLSEVQAYPRIIVEAALNYNARAVILCHNHPGGVCAPSREDIQATLFLKKTLNALDIDLLDHFIVAGSSTFSMKLHGILDHKKKSLLEEPDRKKKKKHKKKK